MPEKLTGGIVLLVLFQLPLKRKILCIICSIEAPCLSLLKTAQILLGLTKPMLCTGTVRNLSNMKANSLNPK
ncbi:ORF970 [White spot syndrome virus]|uniref:ORF970 n=1 Tax=White spot syndrome virus TaxID=342409 RepID=A0A2D3I6E0_9VIRU|nr:ORF970 [White spot syndrome virus]